MNDHLTPVRAVDGLLVAYCPEHRAIGHQQPATDHGMNAVVTEARAHDDIAHGVFRDDLQYRADLIARQLEEARNAPASR